VPGGLTRRDGGVPGPPSTEELALLRRARDLMDRDYARPLDVQAMARAALMSTAHLSRLIQELIDQPYGVRDCTFRDPSGNHLRLSQPSPG